ncbi:MAG: hypothetical protein EHM35_02830, partial [Planctomycetaceae bacterium]
MRSHWTTFQSILICVLLYSVSVRLYAISSEEATSYASNQQAPNNREAIEHFEDAAISAQSLSVGSLSELLKLWESAGGLDGAKRHYAAMTTNANVPAAKVALAHVMLSWISLAERNLPVAREHCWAAIKKTSPPADPWQRGIRRCVLNDIFIARDWLDDAVAAYDNQWDYGSLLTLGEHLRYQGRGIEMLDLYQGYLLSEPPVHEDLIPLRAAGRYAGLATTIIDEIVSLDEAQPLKEKLDAAVAAQPQSPYLYRNLGYLLFKMDRYTDGLRILEQYLAVKDGPSAGDYNWIGDLCKKAGRIEDATQFYERSLAVELTTDDLRREARSSQLPITVGDVRARTLGSLGDLYIGQQRWAQAEACFQKIMNSDAQWATSDAQTKLALVWTRLGKENVLIEELQEKAAKAPTDPQARTAYAGILLKVARASEAVTQYEQAVRSSPGDLSLRLRLAEALVQNRETQRAAGEYREAFIAACHKRREEFRRNKGGDDTEPLRILYRWVGLYDRLGEKDKVLQTYTEVLELLKSPEVQWRPEEYTVSRIIKEVAEIYHVKGEHDRAAKLWLIHRAR